MTMAVALPTGKLGDLVTFKTGKLDSNAAVLDGDYPFFTCSQVTLRTNTYSFDTECVLLAGNNANGIFPLKYFKGKFDAYQRTYVVRPRDTNALLTRYLYYALRLKLSELRSFSTGAATKFLTLKILNATEIELPSFPVQQRIVGILSAYDELIENSQRRIKILESMARAIYREWFVHFRFPGHENHSRVASILGEIPQGWEVKKVCDLVEFKKGKKPPAVFESEANGLQRHLLIDALRGGSAKEFVPPDRLVSTYSSDSIMVMDGSGSGDVFIGHEGVIGSTLGRYRARDDFDVAPFWLFLFFSSHLEEIKSKNIGSAIPHANKDFINSMDAVIGPKSSMQAFEESVEPIFGLIQSLHSKISTLRVTRALLLPRLLSGQIALDEATADVAMHETLLIPQPAAPLPAVSTKQNRIAGAKKDVESHDVMQSIDEVSRDDVLRTIRQVFGNGLERGRDDALRDIARALGYRRLGSRIQGVLSTHFTTAVRRDIVVRDGTIYRLGFHSVADCTRDVLKNSFESALCRDWITRDEAIRAFARWLGFARTGEVINRSARSLINSLLRESRLEADGPELIRKA